MFLLELLLIAQSALASSYADGLARLENLQKRTQSLLSRAGFQSEQSGNREQLDRNKVSSLRIHNDPSRLAIPMGGLAFGETNFRLLVGEEESPLEIIFSRKNPYPLLHGMRIFGRASQKRGRVFAEFDFLRLPSGKSIPIKGELLDVEGSLGVKGENENSKTLEIAGSVALGLIAGPSEPQGPLDTQGSGKAGTSERLRSSLLKESRDYMREQFRERPVIRLDENTAVTIRFKEEVRF